MGRHSTAVAWSMLAIYVASVGIGYFLMVVNGIFQTPRPTTLAYCSLSAPSWSSGRDRGPATRQHYRLDLLGHRPAGRHRPTNLAVRRVRLRHQGRGPPGGDPGRLVHALWFYSAINLGFVFIPLFPTGRLLSPRWRPIAALAAATTTAIVVLSAIKPTLTLQTAGSSIDNPIGVAAVPDPDNSRLGDLLIGLFTICTGLATLSLVLQFRRSQGV